MISQKSEKILLVQTGFLGDVVLSTPVISGIKQIHPHAQLWMMTTRAASPLVKNNPNLSGVITFDKRGAERGLGGIFRKARELKAMGFSKVYSLHKSYRTALLLKLSGIKARVGFDSAALSFLYTDLVKRERLSHDVLRNLLILTKERSLNQLDPSLHLIGAPQKSWSPLLKEIVEAGRYVVLVPGSVWATKRWFPAGYRAVVKDLLASGISVVLAGSPDETELCAKIGDGLPVTDVSGKFTLEEFSSLIERASLLVCNDSMALHVASAFKIPNVAIFCATSPSFGFGPWQNRAIVLEKEGLACKPCAPHGGTVCPLGTESCMKDLSPEAVIQAVRSLLI